jgi:hypothetical protein
MRSGATLEFARMAYKLRRTWPDDHGPFRTTFLAVTALPALATAS